MQENDRQLSDLRQTGFQPRHCNRTPKGEIRDCWLVARSVFFEPFSYLESGELDASRTCRWYESESEAMRDAAQAYAKFLSATKTTGQH